MQDYDSEFYADRDARTRFAAETILSIVQRAIPQIRSAIDVGCGVGTWLNVLRERGAAEILGIDGDWVDPQALVIPSECFARIDLSKDDIRSDNKYDLVISLEVAEHLPRERARHFVNQLTRIGDFILFSAAIPEQGGANHLNEQWPEYWVGSFGERGYRMFDIVRRDVWQDDRIAVHYRQNILLFVKNERVGDMAISNRESSAALALVHPKLYLNKIKELRNPTIPQSVGLLAAAIMRRVRRDLGIRS